MLIIFLPPSGGRNSQAIVDGALNALHTLVKDRMSGRSGGSDYSRQVTNYYLHLGWVMLSRKKMFRNGELLSDLVQ